MSFILCRCFVFVCTDSVSVKSQDCMVIQSVHSGFETAALVLKAESGTGIIPLA